jgi:hypothetical protein
MDSGSPDAEAAGFRSVTLAAAGGARRVSRRRWVNCATALFYAGAAALNQNDEHDGKENAGDYTNQDGAVHLKTPFMGKTL